MRSTLGCATSSDVVRRFSSCSSALIDTPRPLPCARRARSGHGIVPVAQDFFVMPLYYPCHARLVCRSTRRPVAILRSSCSSLCAHRARPVYRITLLALVNSSRPPRLPWCAGSAGLLRHAAVLPLPCTSRLPLRAQRAGPSPYCARHARRCVPTAPVPATLLRC
uniref:Uncharacterized protein n=1 Tax=Plectus sambesii TaxID=2011161 RepID=A0A914W026_9BILA